MIAGRGADGQAKMERMPERLGQNHTLSPCNHGAPFELLPIHTAKAKFPHSLADACL